jgi:CDP-ribitol ribitolphosphotransferase
MEGFNVSEDKMVIAPLPKVDLLRDQKFMAKLAAIIREKYPQLKEKINILYAPTFRKDESEQKIMIQKLIDYVDYDKYNLILCLHPISKLSFDDPRIIVDNQYFTFEMAAVADLVITDYSATTYEMAIMDKKLFYFTFDKEKYDDERGFYTICGGDYDSPASEVTVSSRKGIDTNTKDKHVGFRIIIRKE